MPMLQKAGFIVICESSASCIAWDLRLYFYKADVMLTIV